MGSLPAKSSLRLRLLAKIALCLAPTPGMASDDAAIPDQRVAASGMSSAPASDMTLYLAVSVNGRDAGLAPFVMRGGQMWSNRADLARAGLSVPAAASGSDDVALDAVAGLSYAYDAPTQHIAITVAPALLDQAPTVVTPGAADSGEASGSTGLLLNYDLNATTNGGGTGLSAFTELRAFTAGAVLSSTAITQIRSGTGYRNDSMVRLDTGLTFSLPDKALAIRIGDTLTGAASWSRAVRFGGVHLGTNFGLRPYDVTVPLTRYFGEATLPSTVELYVEGVRQLAGAVPPGPYEIAAPANAGNGVRNGTVVLTDALGRSSSFSVNLYNTPVLLREGLSDWSLDAGFVRRRYGMSSFAYGSHPLGSATIRHGLTNNLTVEASAEGAKGIGNIGAGARWRAGLLGVVSASAAWSGNGVQWGAGYSWADRRTMLSFDLTNASRAYRDLSLLEGGRIPRRTMIAQAQRATDQFGSIGVSFVEYKVTAQPITRLANFTWYKSIANRFNLNLSVNQDLGDSQRTSLFATLNVQFGRRAFASASVQSDQFGTAAGMDVMSSTPEEGGLGWRAQLRQGPGYTNATGELQYLGPAGRITTGLASISGRTTAYAGATGSLVFADGSLLPARTVFDSFAVVSTGDVGGVPVLVRNIPIGRTNKDGKLLVVGLNAYQDNAIAIDAMGLPADVRARRRDQSVIPTDRGGTVVRFSLSRMRAATLRLVDGAGQPIPAGSPIRFANAPWGRDIVGLDGIAYLEGLGDSNQVEVDMGSGRCIVTFDYPVDGGLLPEIGPLTCQVAS